MKPWEVIIERGKKPSDEVLLPLWVDFRPSDFYFAALYSETLESTVVYITPGEYFEKTGFMFYDSIPIVHFLPEYLTEIYESVYETTANVDYVRINMINRGFVNNLKFQEFISKNDWCSAGLDVR
jgi:hypothetical protein